jgi:two-component system, OmpR family, sensor histidine kinase KdpD
MRSMPATNRPGRRTVVGTLVALGGLAALMLVMLPFRTHLSIATPALVFVIPVILGVVVGGSVPGVVGAVAGFVLYDVFFLPPYGNLAVRKPDNWSALIVYVIVVLVVARVVTNLQAARQEAHRREADAGRLFELSQALIGDLSIAQLLEHIVTTVQTVFTPRWTALLLPGSGAGNEADGDALTVVARAGQALTNDDLATLTASAGQTRSLGLPGGDAPSRIAVALVASNRPVGMLVLQEVQFARQDRELLGTFANQAALAVERAQLQEQVLRTRLLEEIDRWRRAMMGAVSHDLRTPLASVKTAVSSLRRDGSSMGADDRAELLELIELQSDRLARLVTNLLDLTRLESGALALQSSAVPFDELVGEALDAVTGLVPPSRVAIETAPDLPLLEIDHVLIAQVLANLLENAARLSPRDALITITARPAPSPSGSVVEISVSDDGPGIPPHERERVFEMFSANHGGGRSGLGLTIAKAFVEAHGGLIWIDPDVTSGARIAFTVPAAVAVSAHA